MAEVVDRAPRKLRRRRSSASEDFVPLEDLQPTMDEIDATPPVAAWVGVPTGFTELDEVTNGLHPGQMIIGRHAQVGKARWTRRSTPAG